MDVMVADTSVLIDLERGRLLEHSFALPFRFKVPDLLYRNELANRKEGPAFGEHLLRLGLEVVELNGDEVSDAVQYRRERPSLSLPDSFALALAVGRKWTLLTGDGALRALAHTLQVSCHGVLWLLDRIFEHGIVSQLELASGLKAIRDHPRCRLPKEEIDRRLLLYSSSAR